MSKDREVQAGMFVVASILLVVITVFMLGREKQIFSASDRFYTSFDDVKGLKEGAPVRLGGITIGRVTEIGFAEDLQDSAVYVTLEVNDKYLPRLKSDAKAFVSSQGLLGDRFLSLTSGTGTTIISPGGTFGSQESGDISDILNTAGSVAQNVASLSETLDSVLVDFEENSAENLRKTLENMKEITGAVSEGDGFAHQIIFSKEDGDQFMKAIENTLESVSKIFKEVENGNGLIHRLVYEKDSGAVLDDFGIAAEHLSEAANVLTEILNEVKEGNGLLHGLIYSEENGDLGKMSRLVNRILTNLDKASTALAKGSGTLGALLMDSTLYDNLTEVTDDAKRSYLLRSAIRSTLNE